jgi:hypothetical protein
MALKRSRKKKRGREGGLLELILPYALRDSGNGFSLMFQGYIGVGKRDEL